MGEAIRQRVRLWLRSEQAMGLDSLPVKLAVAPASPPARQPTRPLQAPPRPQRAVAQPSLASPKPLPVAAPVPAPAPPVSDDPFTSPPLPRQEKIRQLEELRQAEVIACTACRLHETRTQTVFGEGDVDAQIFFVGEGPGATEDRTGRPFVGEAGKKLDEMIAAMGLRRDQVYIANIVKCRPPENRAPAPDEVATCTPVLVRQLEIVRPRVIVTLGVPATQYILQKKIPLGRLRGQWGSWRGIKVMPTFHPAYILRNYTPEVRRNVWSDLRKVMAELALTAAGPGGSTATMQE